MKRAETVLREVLAFWCTGALFLSGQDIVVYFPDTMRRVWRTELNVSLYMQRYGECSEVPAFWHWRRGPLFLYAYGLECPAEKGTEGEHSDRTENSFFHLSDGDHDLNLLFTGERKESGNGSGTFFHVGDQ